MTDFLKEWIVGIAFVSVAGGFILMLCPDGKMKSNVKLVISLIVLIVIISPFFGKNKAFSNSDFLNELDDTTSSQSTGSKALEGSVDAAALVLENEIRSYFTESGVLYSYVKADLEIENDSYILKAHTRHLAAAV